jgi:outer membrane receptor protein involved in Fe transport
MRDLNIPFEFIDPLSFVSEVRRGAGKEYLGRSYLFWTPHDWLALSGEYQHERFKNNQEVAFSFKELATHRIPLGVKFFHPSGLGILLKTTYLNQTGDFIRRGGPAFESGRSDFWVLDAGISYRLPKRYGIFTIGATNLFDKKFKYQETDIRNPTIQPDRVIFGKITVALPYLREQRAVFRRLAFHDQDNSSNCIHHGLS